jgi:hypothetical protein
MHLCHVMYLLTFSKDNPAHFLDKSDRYKNCDPMFQPMIKTSGHVLLTLPVSQFEHFLLTRPARAQLFDQNQTSSSGGQKVGWVVGIKKCRVGKMPCKF